MRLTRSVWAILALLAPVGAYGQPAVLQGGPWAQGHAPMYSGSGRNQPVIQDSGPAGGGALGIGLSELGITSRSATNTYPSASSGTGPFNTHSCMYDAPITNSTGYHYLCFDPNAQGGGLIAYGTGGTASQLPLFMKLNGATYQFPFSISGILGPNSTVIDDIVAWNNTAGTLVKDTGVKLSQLATLNASTTTGQWSFAAAPVFTTLTGPVFGNGASPATTGTLSGNTTQLATVSGSFTAGHGITPDANGNLVDTGSVQMGAVTTMASLRALTGGVYSQVYLTGYYAAGDGGEGVYQWNGASSATDDGGIVIAPNTGSGRWIRLTYATTPNIRWWGAHCDWNGTSGTDDGAIINKAVAWLVTVNGGVVEWPRGCNAAISTPILVSNSSIGFRGPGGAADTHNTGTAKCAATLQANAAMTTTMVQFYNSAFGAGTQFLTGNSMKNLCLMGNNHAASGLSIVSERQGEFSQLYFENFALVPLALQVAPALNGGHALGDPCDSQFNDFHNITLNQFNTSVGVGMYLAGHVDNSFPNHGCNVSLNTFTNIDIDVTTQTGIEDLGNDSNDWKNVRIFLVTPGPSSPSIIFDKAPTGPGTAFWSQSHVFYHLSTNGFMQVNGLSNSIQFLALDNGNGTPTPACTAGTAHSNWTYLSGVTGSC